MSIHSALQSHQRPIPAVEALLEDIDNYSTVLAHILKAKNKSTNMKLRLEPIEPLTYDGTPNFQKISRFVIESSRYMDDISISYKLDDSEEDIRLLNPKKFRKYNGNPEFQQFAKFMLDAYKYAEEISVCDRLDHPSEQLHRISYFLEGPANDFYWSHIQMDMDYKKRLTLTLPEFFKILFKQCFGTEFSKFKMQYLDKYRQGNKAVGQYAADFKRLFFVADEFDMPISERQKAWKFYDGLREPIQTGCGLRFGY